MLLEWVANGSAVDGCPGRVGTHGPDAPRAANDRGEGPEEAVTGSFCQTRAPVPTLAGRQPHESTRPVLNATVASRVEGG